MTVDPTTKRWIRNASDELAAEAGYRFDVERGAWTVWWIERYCRLYEGDWAGEPLVLRGAASVDAHIPILIEWDAGGREASLSRAEAYADAVEAGEAVDWQYDTTMRVFGWVKHSDRWGREIRRFRKASVFVAKKNKKSPTLSSWGMYLLSGDGEPGQKIFFAAKDGKQAREICGLHAVEMLSASPELNGESSLNKSKMQITHEASRSILLPLSSSNSRTKEAKEGLNGSVLIDETHVVDRDFIARISRAGISRSEPLHAEFSTAGNNPDSYGKERFDYGLRVESGEYVDHQLFFTAYCAPQDLSDADLDADPVKYGKMANPSWGHTIGEEEFLADYNESKVSVSTLAAFKMYRLNIWQRSTNPWLKMDDWHNCGQEFTEADLYGRPCGGAFDLSKTEDMTALALQFPEEDSDDDTEDRPVKLLTWYWLPEAVIHKHGHEVPYAQWQAEGWLRIVPGDVIDYRFVRREIIEILSKFDVRVLAFDPWNASPFVQSLTQDDGYGGEMVEFTQTIKHFAEPTSAFERLVIAGKMQHNNHPITTWQAGHVQTWSDANNNIRPIKPESNNIKKIDGIVAAIMALDASTRLPSPSPYASRGFLTI